MPEEDRAKHINYLLDLIDHHLTYRDDHSRRLWAILSALRGPDESGASELKYRTTVALRSAAFPKTANLAYPYANGAEFGTVGMDLPHIVHENLIRSPHALTIPDGTHVHFLNHVRDAVRALETLGRAPLHTKE
jgi:hypothetical protein